MTVTKATHPGRWESETPLHICLLEVKVSGRMAGDIAANPKLLIGLSHPIAKEEHPMPAIAENKPSQSHCLRGA